MDEGAVLAPPKNEYKIRDPFSIESTKCVAFATDKFGDRVEATGILISYKYVQEVIPEFGLFSKGSTTNPDIFMSPKVVPPLRPKNQFG